MRVRVLGCLSAGLLLAGAAFFTTEQAAAQTGEPYKLGTFSIDGRTRSASSCRDSIVVDLAAANRDYETKNASAAKVHGAGRHEGSDRALRHRRLAAHQADRGGLVTAKQLEGAYARRSSGTYRR